MHPWLYRAAIHAQKRQNHSGSTADSQIRIPSHPVVLASCRSYDSPTFRPLFPAYRRPPLRSEYALATRLAMDWQTASRTKPVATALVATSPHRSRTRCTFDSFLFAFVQLCCDQRNPNPLSFIERRLLLSSTDEPSNDTHTYPA
jgi:hypothetical protein